MRVFSQLEGIYRYICVCGLLLSFFRGKQTENQHCWQPRRPKASALVDVTLFVGSRWLYRCFRQREGGRGDKVVFVDLL